jgi:hypothetical protein
MKNASGCARAEGFRPIPWEVKVKYLQFHYTPTLRSDQVKVCVGVVVGVGVTCVCMGG